MSNSQSREVFACDGALSAGAAASGLKQSAQIKTVSIISIRLRANVCSVSVRGDFPQLAAVIGEQEFCRETRDGQASAQACPGICPPSQHSRSSTCSGRSAPAPLPVLWAPLPVLWALLASLEHRTSW